MSYRIARKAGVPGSAGRCGSDRIDIGLAFLCAVRCRNPLCWLAVLVLCVASGRAADDRAALREAVAATCSAAISAAAEQKLRPEVAAHPNDAPALSLLGVALDNQNQFREAAEFHRRAVAAAPRSSDVLSNYGSHLAATGEDAAARDAFLKAIELEPANVNANLQLARQSIKRKNGAEALRYLKRLTGRSTRSAQGRVGPPGSALPGGRRRTGRRPGDAALRRGDKATRGMNFPLGLALANGGRFEQAEPLFARALAAAPADFNILFNLGAVAVSAGHYERAREVFETASRQQPQNVEVLVPPGGCALRIEAIAGGAAAAGASGQTGAAASRHSKAAGAHHHRPGRFGRCAGGLGRLSEAGAGRRFRPARPRLHGGAHGATRKRNR